MCNLYLLREQRIDHRSFERQGLEQVPTIHEGYVERQMERRGEVSERMELNRVIRRLNQMLAKMKNAIASIGDSLMKLKEDLWEVRVSYGEERSRNAASDIGRNALCYVRIATIDSGDYRGTAPGQSEFDTGTETNSGTGTRDSFIKGISDEVERRARRIGEVLAERKKLYERFERLQMRRADGSAGANGSDAGRVGAEGRADMDTTRENIIASGIIRMARSKATDARANDTASRAIVNDSTAGRENRDVERKRQISERESKAKERKRGMSR